MNIAHGHFSAQGNALPSKQKTHPYGLTEEANEKLQRAAAACDFLQLLLSEYPRRDYIHFGEGAAGMAAITEYIRADLADAKKGCELLTEKDL